MESLSIVLLTSTGKHALRSQFKPVVGVTATIVARSDIDNYAIEPEAFIVYYNRWILSNFPWAACQL
jgi:hypothetical protein